MQISKGKVASTQKSGFILPVAQVSIAYVMRVLRSEVIQAVLHSSNPRKQPRIPQKKNPLVNRTKMSLILIMVQLFVVRGLERQRRLLKKANAKLISNLLLHWGNKENVCFKRAFFPLKISFFKKNLAKFRIIFLVSLQKVRNKSLNLFSVSSTWIKRTHIILQPLNGPIPKFKWNLTYHIGIICEKQLQISNAHIFGKY